MTHLDFLRLSDCQKPLENFFRLHFKKENQFSENLYVMEFMQELKRLPSVSSKNHEGKVLRHLKYRTKSRIMSFPFDHLQKVIQWFCQCEEPHNHRFYIAVQCYCEVASQTRTTGFICILLALKQAFEVDKTLGDVTRGADFTMEVIWHNIPLLG